MILHRFNALETAAAALAAQVAGALCEALQLRGHASLVVPGGRTPSALFRALRRWEMDWAQVVGSSRVDLQACKLEYSIVSPK